MLIRSYVQPDKRLGDSCEQRSAELCIETTGFCNVGIELANDPQSQERWRYSYWLYLQQPMRWPFIDCWKKQVRKCLVDL